MRRLETNQATLAWSADGTTVTKTRVARADGRQRFRNERRVARLVTVYPPPVATPALVAHDAQRRSLVFEALAGEPVGPKFPTALADDKVDAIATIVDELRDYKPRRAWFRRLDSVAGIRRAHRAALVTGEQADHLAAVARRVHRCLRFAHGDVTARNVVACPDGYALIDWEWAGLYPPGYDLAFLWYSLIDLAGGRARIEQRVDVDEQSFLLSALLINLRHLELFVPAAFRPNHLKTRDDLLVRLGC